MKTSLDMPERYPMLVHSVATKAEWLDGMLPVRHNMSSNSSATLWTLPENSFTNVFMRCAHSQLKMQDNKTGFEKNKRNCSLAFAMFLFYYNVKFCLVANNFFLVLFYNYGFYKLYGRSKRSGQTARQNRKAHISKQLHIKHLCRNSKKTHKGQRSKNKCMLFTYRRWHNINRIFSLER